MSPSRPAFALLFLAVALLVEPLSLAGPLSAQEVRVTGSRPFPGISVLDGAWGQGVGVRWIRGGGIGVALEYDAFSGSTRIQAPVCAPGAGDGAGTGSDCVVESVGFDSEMDVLTLALVLPLVQGDDWHLRLGVGRSAGTMAASGVGESGGAVEPPSADRDGSLLAWNRGADGSVFWLEVHRDVPGPLPVRVMGSYRFQQLELDGCRTGEFSPFCGRVGGSELHLGLIAFWPR
ncbi:MAG: hypothetical protein EA422_12485 [Gemmatimonadales bacterium]|nr:MAG: hypothetical protein EA422_12485 [Gemmatimonadales bacterium]